jgi:hypothetical protein
MNITLNFGPGERLTNAVIRDIVRVMRLNNVHPESHGHYELRVPRAQARIFLADELREGRDYRPVPGVWTRADGSSAFPVPARPVFTDETAIAILGDALLIEFTETA